MKKLTLIILLATALMFFQTKVNAATAEFRINHENKEFYPNSEITVPINIASTDPYNAYTANIVLENLEFVELIPAENWSTFLGPDQSENRITYTAALLGFDKYATGEKKVFDLKVKIPSDGTYKISVNGTVALTDEEATLITLENRDSSHNVGPNIVESIKTDLQNESSTMSIALRIFIGITVIVVSFFVFKALKRFYS